jgi:cytochrome c oxidase subunit 2
MIAEQYLFVPQCVVVPTGVPIQLRMTSADVVHQLTITGTTDAMEVGGCRRAKPVMVQSAS